MPLKTATDQPAFPGPCSHNHPTQSWWEPVREPRAGLWASEHMGEVRRQGSVGLLSVPPPLPVLTAAASCSHVLGTQWTQRPRASGVRLVVPVAGAVQGAWLNPTWRPLVAPDIAGRAQTQDWQLWAPHEPAVRPPRWACPSCFWLCQEQTVAVCLGSIRFVHLCFFLVVLLGSSLSILCLVSDLEMFLLF